MQLIAAGEFMSGIAMLSPEVYISQYPSGSSDSKIPQANVAFTLHQRSLPLAQTDHRKPQRVIMQGSIGHGNPTPNG